MPEAQQDTAAAATDPANELGPGGVPTPTQPVGGTPTPPDGGLKPLSELLGQEDKEPAAAAEPAAEEPKAESAAEPAAAPAPEGGPAARINKLTAEKWEEKRAREAAEARARLAEETLAELVRANPDLAQHLQQPGSQAPAAQPERRFTQAELQQEAARLAAQNIYNEKVNKTVLDGRAVHPDFDQSVEALKQITGPIVPPEFILAALETGNASELIYDLGKNPGEADRILSLPPIQQAVALARYADGLAGRKTAASSADAAAPANVSRAPPPIAPKIGGSARREPSIDDPNLPLSDFIRLRNEKERAERQRQRA